MSIDLSSNSVPDVDTDDVPTFTSPDLGGAVVYSTDWTVETLLSQIRKGNIKLDPAFQRRDAWTLARKSKYIESLILGLPVPQVVLAEAQSDRGRFLVLDGKQRLLSLAQFSGLTETQYTGFRLRELDVRRDLERKAFTDLQQDELLDSDLAAFLNQTIRAVVIRNWPSIDFLHLVFIRLNTGSVSLSTQELRQALFPGPFVSFADECSVNSLGLRLLLQSDSPDFRMRDLEIFVRYFAFTLYLPGYRGDIKHFLDTACDNLNNSWADKEGDIRQHAERFENVVKAAADIFGHDSVGRKWSGDKYERLLNRAVLDVQLYFLSDDDLRKRCLEEKESVLSAFQQLSNQTEFRRSVETTTKSLDATHFRFQGWRNALSAVLKQDIAFPLSFSGW